MYPLSLLVNHGRLKKLKMVFQSFCPALCLFCICCHYSEKHSENVPSLFFVLSRYVVMRPPASVISPGQGQTAASGIRLGTFTPPRMKDPRVCVISGSIHCILNLLVLFQRCQYNNLIDLKRDTSEYLFFFFAIHIYNSCYCRIKDSRMMYQKKSVWISP